MDLKDIAYRAGLIFAAFLLAGIFAQQLVQISSNADDEEVRGSVRALKEAVKMLLSSSEGSSLVVSFGVEGEDVDNALLLPGGFDGESYFLEALPGLLALKWVGGREIVMEDPSLVPCCPPANSAAINSTQLDVIKYTARGFRSETPCRLILSRPVGSLGALYVHVPKNAANSAFGELSHLLASSPSPYPGGRDEVRVHVPFGGLVKERLLIIHGGGGEGPDGEASSFPFVLPAETSVETNGKYELPPCSDVLICRETLMRPDGNLTVLTRLSFNPPRGLIS